MYKNQKILTLIIFLFFIFSSAFAGGRQEENFKEIDSYIDSKEYNSALLLLNEYIKENPEDFDNAQKRVNEVMDVRSHYAKLAAEIIDVIINEPTNDEKKLKLIAELEAIEENPSEATREFIAQTKAAAEFTYFRSKFEEIITKGSEETQNQDYVASLKTNYTGFELYRTHFHESGYPLEFVDSVESRITEIASMIEKYASIESKLDIAYKNLITALDMGNITQSKRMYNTFEKVMIEYAEIRNFIVESGWYFKDSFTQLQEENPNLTEASFLAFAYRFVLGRGSDLHSGMLPALDIRWNYYVDGVKPYVSNQLAINLESLNEEFPKINVDSVYEKKDTASALLSNIQSYVDLGVSVEKLNELIKVDSENFIDVSKSEKLASFTVLNKYISCFTNTLDNIESYKIILAKNLHNQVPTNPDIEIKNNNYEYKNVIFTKNQELRTIEKEINNIISTLNAEKSHSWDKNFSLLNDILLAAKNEYSINISENGKNLSSWFSTGTSLITSDYEKVYNQCYEMLNENLSTEVLSYPLELQEILNRKNENLPKDIKSLEEVLSFFQEDSSMENADKIKIENDIKTLNSILDKSLTLVAKAKERVRLAELSKNEAELRYNQAEQAFLRGDYDSCRDYIEKSRSKYNESLLYQESEELRITSDEKLLALGDRIIRGENEIVVKEVRELKTRAKNAYYAGNFESAENILNQAKIRWSVTNSEADPEIESLLSLVGTALSMKTGRTISPTAPLYPEMSQLLNIANQYYNEGKNLLAKGMSTEAHNSFEKAKEKLREVQTVYPLNQEASLLSLRIDKLIDEKAFNEYFSRKVENAKKEYLDKSKQQNVYTELLDLYEINPTYPGLKDFIYNVEIALGIRVKPPDTSSLRKAEQLTAQAQKVYDADSRNEVSLNSALQLVNQALEANPDSTEAQILKDRISTSLGGSGTAVLPASAEMQYQQAVQELQRGNTLQAYAIVSKLMENNTYKKSSKIIDLMKKVESLL